MASVEVPIEEGALLHRDVSVGEDGLNGCSLGSHMSLSRDLFKGQFEPVVLEILVQLFRALGYLLPTIFANKMWMIAASGREMSRSFSSASDSEFKPSKYLSR